MELGVSVPAFYISACDLRPLRPKSALYCVSRRPDICLHLKIEEEKMDKKQKISCRDELAMPTICWVALVHAQTLHRGVREEKGLS